MVSSIPTTVFDSSTKQILKLCGIIMMLGVTV